MNKEEIALRLTEMYEKHNNITNKNEKRFTDIYNTMLENIKDTELQQRIDKVIKFIGECIENETNCVQTINLKANGKEIHKYFIDSEIILKILEGKNNE